jgi:hypothetical protein
VSVRPCICRHGTAWLPLDGFPGNLILYVFWKPVERPFKFYCNLKRIRILYMKTYANFNQCTLGCLYRASSSTYYSEITNGCNSLFYVFISFFLLIFTLHVSGSYKPIIRGISSCFLIYNHLVYVVFMLFICVCPWSGLSWCTVEYSETTTTDQTTGTRRWTT